MRYPLRTDMPRLLNLAASLLADVPSAAKRDKACHGEREAGDYSTSDWHSCREGRDEYGICLAVWLVGYTGGVDPNVRGRQLAG